MKKRMTKLERVLATFVGAETDRVPVYDLLLSDACIKFFTGRIPTPDEDGARLQAQAADRMLDMARGVGQAPQASQAITSDDGFVYLVDRYTGRGYEKRPFETYEGAVEWAKTAVDKKIAAGKKIDLAKFAQKTREEFRKIYSWLGEDHVVCCLRQSEVGLDSLRARLGIEFFCYASVDFPDLISQYMEAVTEQEIAMIHAIADPAMSPFALPYGDIAIKGRLLHSPDWLRREFFPRLARVCDAYHQHGIQCLFHSDGYLMEVMDDLVAAGIDGINPIETVAGMDVGEVYRKYGDRIFLTGGIDMSQLLSFGTPKQVKDACRAAIAAAPRRYFLGSTTEIDNSSKLENVLVMLEAAWGERPISAVVGR